jgi:AraC family transcriptional regulator
MEHAFKNGRLYTDGIGAAMACQLLQDHSLAARTMPAVRLRRVLGYIKDNRDGELSLAAIAAFSGMNLSHSHRAFSA